MKTFLDVPQKVHHGLWLATELAGVFRSGRALSLETVSRRAGISQGYLETIAGALRRAELISGQRGQGGGYRLARDPWEISVAEIIAAIEGPLDVVPCLGGAPCDLVDECANRDVWSRLRAQMVDFLAGTSVAEAAGLGRAKKLKSPIAKKHG
ncbi:hypothetical protein A3C96_02835 [Candidatus Uhrbacteria bacterium RIFCSPHIGHO2_02_FULL_60_10]|uniref:Rrf2 family transcriptional regulator n=1 Tax=Candidatus Uhrbacteria bacterium RIFCSPHIGHO2_02_FULL_60_10 TaxID=1802392 RepID=A0A1F7U3F9_9BACT|nr:MAG: hypothetical protein A3C96_02835 [Candidatus Uhrbacteria bacterium RIFCSPHIGHO2_02_FULL_60_10]